MTIDRFQESEPTGEDVRTIRYPSLSQRRRTARQVLNFTIFWCPVSDSSRRRMDSYCLSTRIVGTHLDRLSAAPHFRMETGGLKMGGFLWHIACFKEDAFVKNPNCHPERSEGSLRKTKCIIIADVWDSSSQAPRNDNGCFRLFYDVIKNDRLCIPGRLQQGGGRLRRGDRAESSGFPPLDIPQMGPPVPMPEKA